MTIRTNIVSAGERFAPRLINLGRYWRHVVIAGDMVYPDLTRRLFDIVNARHTQAIDVGANVGIFARYLSSHFNHVWAVEPLPNLAGNLRRVGISNMTVVNAALGSGQGELTLRIPFDEDGNDLFALSTAAPTNKLRSFGAAGMREIAVPQLRLDDVADRRSRVTFIKIDVEGFENEVLKGADQLVAQDRPIFMLEIARAHNPEWEFVLSYFARRGYTGFGMNKGGLVRDPRHIIAAQPETLTMEIAAHTPVDFAFIPKELQERVGPLERCA